MTLSEAIVIRISHDLAGAVGAFSNTVDLMRMDASFITESVELLETTSHQLNARLAFFRALFGAETKSIDTALLQRYLKTLAISVQFEGALNTRLQLALVAVGLELVGTQATLILKDQQLRILGKDLTHNTNLIQMLMGTQIPSDPKLVMAEWLVQLVKQDELIIRLEAGDDMITISLT